MSPNAAMSLYIDAAYLSYLESGIESIKAEREQLGVTVERLVAERDSLLAELTKAQEALRAIAEMQGEEPVVARWVAQRALGNTQTI